MLISRDLRYDLSLINLAPPPTISFKRKEKRQPQNNSNDTPNHYYLVGPSASSGNALKLFSLSSGIKSRSQITPRASHTVKILKGILI